MPEATTTTAENEPEQINPVTGADQTQPVPSQEQASPEQTTETDAGEGGLAEEEVAQFLKEFEADDEGTDPSSPEQKDAQAGQEGQVAKPEAATQPPPQTEPTVEQKTEPATTSSEQPTTTQPPSQEAAQAVTDLTQGRSAQELAQAIEQYRSQAVEQLATSVYSLTKEEAEEIETDPGTALVKMIPKAMARVHIEAQLAAINQVARILPAFMQQINTVQTEARQFEDKFFEKWPALKNHYSTVTQAAQMYRQMNPQAKPDDVIKNVGLYSMMQLGLPVDGMVQQRRTDGQAVQQQQVIQPQQPFAPVATRAGQAGAASPNQPQNKFALLAEEELAEMR